MIKKILNVPHLRFKEFSGEWKRCKIGNILKIKSGKDQKAIEKPIGKYNIYGTGGIIGKTDAFLYDKESIGIGRKGTIDRPFYFNQPFWTVDTLFYSEIKVEYCVKFIYYLFETINWKMYDESTGVPSLSSSTIESIGVYITDKKEQEKIATFLTLIDKRIETQMKIIEEYKSLIKGIREKLIYKNKKLNKKIRINDIAKCLGGYAFDSSLYIKNGKYKIITIGNVTGDEFINISNTNFIDKLPNDIHNYQILKKNDILISLTGNVGRVSKVICENCLLNQRVAVLQINNNNFQDYIYYCLSSKKFENQMTKCAQGAAQKNINNFDVENFNIPFSNNNNYILNICNFMKIFDLLLHNNIKLLDNYNYLKEYLLNNVFI